MLIHLGNQPALDVDALLRQHSKSSPTGSTASLASVQNIGGTPR